MLQTVSLEDMLAAREHRAAVQQQLLEKYRLPLYLYYYEGYATAEIAQMLRRADSSVRSDLRRGRLLLKQELGGAEV